ncbi:TetR/AcrR family transcriptional regulator [Nocardioides insulae]|uniref:TetR/AcrR family transcriptional regulator n=1 Tax=Nocardioides insulae TaxID=394734 RepID=UPI000413967C|nr:TetR/AcrR family transcriptional regulator [Nocardioides insulae]
MSAEPATRPRNRKQLIADAAGRVFNERGYHGASMEEIGARVGITAAAVYRHFPNKYALFAQCANNMVDRLLEALDGLPPDADLARRLAAITRVTVDHRETGGVYRWEARYLDRADREVLRGKFGDVVGRVTESVRREHPWPDADLRAAAALGAIGSITRHRTSIAQRRVEGLLLDAARRVASTDPSEALGGRAVDLPAQPPPRTRRGEILAAAVPLFHRDGFATVTMGRIAEAVGLAPSAIYRHYPGKGDILTAACLQAVALLNQAVDRSLDGVEEAEAAVRSLAAVYVAFSFEHTALTSVAEAELVGLPVDVQRPLLLAQREHITVWAQQLRSARPELDARAARVLVHAGFGVVVEAGRRLRWDNTQRNRDAVTRLVLSALGVDAPE